MVNLIGVTFKMKNFRAEAILIHLGRQCFSVFKYAMDGRLFFSHLYAIYFEVSFISRLYNC